VSPGVGHYQTESSETRKRSPVCKIGNSARFEKPSALRRYAANLPVAYQSNLERDNSAPRKKLGVIGNERRWMLGPEKVLPGPGEYNT
jgi:hypothetical protein